MAKLTAVAAYVDFDADVDLAHDVDTDLDARGVDTDWHGVGSDELGVGSDERGVGADDDVVVIGAGRRVRATVDLGQPGRVTRLADLRTAGLVRQASEPVGRVEQSLPVSAQLRPLLPGGVLRRGGTVAVAANADGRSASSRAGATSLLFALVAEASSSGSWCAVVGLPRLGLVAAAEAGVAVERFALVPHPGPDWAAVVAALIDGVDIVVVATPGPVAAAVASRLGARARQRGAVLIPVGQWPGADLTLTVTGDTWHGLGQGRGRLRTRDLEVHVQGRGAAARGRRAMLSLPARELAERPSAQPGVADLVPPLKLAPELVSELGLAG